MLTWVTDGHAHNHGSHERKKTCRGKECDKNVSNVVMMRLLIFADWLLCPCGILRSLFCNMRCTLLSCSVCAQMSVPLLGSVAIAPALLKLQGMGLGTVNM